MSVRLLIGIGAFCVAMSGVWLQNMFLMMMIGEVNRKRPGDKLVSYFGFTPAKVSRVFNEYRSEYPEGKLRIYFWAACALTLFGLFGFAVAVRIIGSGPLELPRFGGQ